MEQVDRYSLTALLKANPELLIQALVYLRMPEVLRFGVVSKAAQEICENDHFWKLKTRRDFGATYETPHKGTRWKEEYTFYLHQKGKELIDASSKGDYSKVKALLDFGVPPNLKNRCEESALICASRKGHVTIVALLLKRGANPNITSYRKQTALIKASMYAGHLGIVKLLLEANADPNQQDMYGQTALTKVRGTFTYEISELLLRYGAAIDHQTDQGYTPLIWAAASYHPNCVQLLLDRGADFKIKNKYGRTALDAARRPGVLISKITEQRRAEVIRILQPFEYR